MRAVVIGGTGSMGQAVARDLLKQGLFERVVIGDIRVDEDLLHEKLRADSRVSLEKIDLYDLDRVVKLIRGAGVVVNCAGPFYKTAIPVVKAALKAKVNYVDICDDYEATEMLLSSTELDEKAKDSNIVILTGMGSDPGTNNLLVKWYAQKLDSVEDIYLYWVVSIAEISGAAMDHSLHMMLGKVPQYMNGKLERIEGGEGEETLLFLPPLGECVVRFVGHPQPLTIPKYIPGVRNVVIKGGLIPKWVDEYLVKQKEMGFLQEEEVSFREVRIKPYDFTLIMWNNMQKAKDLGPAASGLKVVVRGRKGSSVVEFTADIVGRMAPGTGLPAAIAAGMLVRGLIKERGILPPEGCIDPKEFLREFIKRGARIHERIVELRTLDSNVL